MTRRAAYRLQSMGSREENPQSIQGFNATEEVIPTSAFGSSSLCHPELVSGSGFDPVGGRWTVDGQPSLLQRSAFFSKRSAVLRSRC
jgi:hypothetical protein